MLLDRKCLKLSGEKCHLCTYTKYILNMYALVSIQSIQLYSKVHNISDAACAHKMELCANSCSVCEYAVLSRRCLYILEET